MDEAAALELFGGTDEDAARAGFDCLCELGRRFLRAYLRGRARPEDAEDVIQSAYLRLWGYRGRFRNAGVGAWYALLYRTAAQCLIDQHRSQGREITAPEPLEADEPREVDEPLGALAGEVHAGRLFEKASCLWLGLDPALSPETHVRQLLAAQLFYEDGETWETVLSLIGPGPASEPRLTRALLDEWLSDPGVLRFLAYQTLYFSNVRLTLVLLGLMVPEAEGEAVLDRLLRKAAAGDAAAPAPGGWTLAEAAVLQWRYRHALFSEQIRARQDCSLSSGELEALLDRSRERFPFSHEMGALLASLERAGGIRPREVLAAPGLWQRLAFQYCYADSLPHRDIRERVQPAAEHVDYTLTLGMLNVWLSNGRLVQRLARYCAAGGETDAET